MCAMCALLAHILAEQQSTYARRASRARELERVRHSVGVCVCVERTHICMHSQNLR